MSEDQWSVYTLIKGLGGYQWWGDNCHKKPCLRFIITTWETERVSGNVWPCIGAKGGFIYSDENTQWKKCLLRKGERETSQRWGKAKIWKWDFKIFCQIKVISQFIIGNWFTQWEK